MKKVRNRRKDPDLLPEYDFRRGIRGKYASRYASGTNIVMLDPDLTVFFPDSKAVNETLRAVVDLARRTRPKVVRG
jgi:hypothetical protein